MKTYRLVSHWHRPRLDWACSALYQVTTDDKSQHQIGALPPEALTPFAEARAALELAPWNGMPYHSHRPSTPMRTISFGPHGKGEIVYLILDDQRRVDILVVLWLA